MIRRSECLRQWSKGQDVRLKALALAASSVTVKSASRQILLEAQHDSGQF